MSRPADVTLIVINVPGHEPIKLGGRLTDRWMGEPTDKLARAIAHRLRDLTMDQLPPADESGWADEDPPED
jgi:hypothetical protein